MSRRRRSDAVVIRWRNRGRGYREIRVDTPDGAYLELGPPTDDNESLARDLAEMMAGSRGLPIIDERGTEVA